MTQESLIENLLNEASVKITGLPYSEIKTQHPLERKFGINTIPKIINQAKEQYALQKK
jgi:hypothetical protein